MSLVSKPVDANVKGCLKRKNTSPLSPATPRPKWSPFKRKRRPSTPRGSTGATTDSDKQLSLPRNVKICEPSKKSLEDLRSLYGDQGIGGYRPTRDIYIMAKRVKAGLPPLPSREPPATIKAIANDSDEEDEFLSIKPKPRLLSPTPVKARSKSPPLRNSSLSPARGARTSSPVSVARRRNNRSPDTRPKDKPRVIDLTPTQTATDADDEDFEDVSSGASTPERVNPPVLPFTALDPSISPQLVAQRLMS